MVSRTASAVIALPILLFIVWVGAPWFTLLVAVASAIGTWELCTMARRWGDRPITAVAVLGAVALVVAAQLLANAYSPATKVLPIASVGAAGSLGWLLWRREPGSRLSGWWVTAGAAIYIGGLLFHAPLLRALDQGREWVLFLLLVTFATDTGAFFVGRALGRRPLAPSISPSKTWEGAFGGAIAAVGASFASVYALALDVALWDALVLGVLVGTVGQLGDLAESRLKRMAGVKDSGWTVPGHGGVLDRLDSIVFNLVVVYYLVP